ncbi:MAG TPA: hemolysin family protein [Micromonosporaceae bacterium]
MSGHWLQLGLVAVLIVLNAIFAGSEMALVSLREGQLRRLEKTGQPGRRVAALARDPNRFLATIQIGITLAGFLASATAAVSLAGLLQPALGFLGRAAEPVAIVAVTLVLTFLTLVLGELAPKRVAMQHAERWALLVARPLGALAAVARPAVWLLSRSSDLAVRLFGGDPTKHREDITPAEIRDLVVTHKGFTAEQRMIISGAVEITERVLREVLVARPSVFSLDASLPVARARVELARSGHSRAPVVRQGNLDDTVGVVALRDLVLVEPATLSDAARPAYLLPDSLRVSDALRRFKADREQFALVVDEHGAVDGIVTLEDLVEEVVGEIYDETDRDLAAVVHEADGAMVVPGTFPVHDLPDLGIDATHLTDADYTTVAGLVIAQLGRLATRPGDVVTIDGWTAEVAAVHRRAITRVRLRPVRRSDHANLVGLEQVR